MPLRAVAKSSAVASSAGSPPPPLPLPLPLPCDEFGSSPGLVQAMGPPPKDASPLDRGVLIGGLCAPRDGLGFTAEEMAGEDKARGVDAGLRPEEEAEEEEGCWKRCSVEWGVPGLAAAWAAAVEVEGCARAPRVVAGMRSMGVFCFKGPAPPPVLTPKWWCWAWEAICEAAWL